MSEENTVNETLTIRAQAMAKFDALMNASGGKQQDNTDKNVTQMDRVAQGLQQSPNAHAQTHQANVNDQIWARAQERLRTASQQKDVSETAEDSQEKKKHDHNAPAQSGEFMWVKSKKAASGAAKRAHVQHMEDQSVTTSDEIVTQRERDDSQNDTHEKKRQKIETEIAEIERMLRHITEGDKDVDVPHWRSQLEVALGEKQRTLEVLGGASREGLRRPSHDRNANAEQLMPIEEETIAQNHDSVSPELRTAMDALENARQVYVEADGKILASLQRLGNFVRGRGALGAANADLETMKKSYHDAQKKYYDVVIREELGGNVDRIDAEMILRAQRIHEFTKVEHLRQELRLQKNPVWESVKRKTAQIRDDYAHMSIPGRLVFSFTLSAATVGIGTRALSCAMAYAGLRKWQERGVLDALELEGHREEDNIGREVNHILTGQDVVANTGVENNAVRLQKLIESDLERFHQNIQQKHYDTMKKRLIAGVGAGGVMFAGMAVGDMVSNYFSNGGSGDVVYKDLPIPPLADVTPIAEPAQTLTESNVTTPIPASVEQNINAFIAERAVPEDMTITEEGLPMDAPADVGAVEVAAEQSHDVGESDMHESVVSPTHELVGLDGFESGKGTLTIDKGSSVEGTLQTFLMQNYENLVDGKWGWDPEKYTSVKEWAGVRAHVLAGEHLKQFPDVNISLVQPGTVIEMDVTNPGDIKIAVQPYHDLSPVSGIDGDTTVDFVAAPPTEDAGSDVAYTEPPQEALDGNPVYTHDTHNASHTIYSEGSAQDTVTHGITEHPLHDVWRSMSVTEQGVFQKDISMKMRYVFSLTGHSLDVPLGYSQQLPHLEVHTLLEGKEALPGSYEEALAQNIEVFMNEAKKVFTEPFGEPKAHEKISTYFMRIAAQAKQVGGGVYEQLFKNVTQ